MADSGRSMKKTRGKSKSPKVGPTYDPMGIEIKKGKGKQPKAFGKGKRKGY